MLSSDLPRILIVDDEDTGKHGLGLGDGAKSLTRHPNDIEPEDLEWADLVLMDFMLEHWATRESLEQLSLRPPNGLALSAVLREHADNLHVANNNYSAFAIHTGKLEKLSQRLHTTNQVPHIVARLNNLEWVFNKSDDTRFKNAILLAKAVRVLSDRWVEVQEGGIDTALELLLRLDAEKPWYLRAFNDVVLSQIPLSDLSSGMNGLLFLRWLLHSVLPYPTFLWAEQWVAARLWITPAALRVVLKSDSVLAKDLNECLYCGILDEFVGSRWWRAGIEQFAWKIRAEGAREPTAFHEILEEKAGQKLEHLNFPSPVVCLERSLNATDVICDIENAVRVVPDLWPGFADTAYTSISCIKADKEFAALVHPLDRERIEETYVDAEE